MHLGKLLQGTSNNIRGGNGTDNAGLGERPAHYHNRFVKKYPERGGSALAITFADQIHWLELDVGVDLDSRWALRRQRLELVAGPWQEGQHLVPDALGAGCRYPGAAR
jgi:hypothetical protein